jgi:membrane protein YdbS with pleckstrin-like domain
MVDHPEELILVDERRHGIVLVRPLGRALLLALLGVGGFVLGWPASVPGGVLLLAAAGYAVAAVWRWDRTHVIVTTEKLLVSHGIVRRRAATVHLARVATVELDESVLGRLLGYGTLVAGDLEVRCVPQAREVTRVLQRVLG